MAGEVGWGCGGSGGDVETLFFGQSGRQMSGRRENGAHSSCLSHDFGPEHLGTTNWTLKNSVISTDICTGIVYLLFSCLCRLTAIAFHLQQLSSLTGTYKAPRMRLANEPDPTFHSFADDIYIQGVKK